jgi:hypothetical protein
MDKVNLAQFYLNQVMEIDKGFNFFINVNQLRTCYGMQLDMLLDHVYILPMTKDFELNPSAKLVCSEKTQFMRIRYEDLSEFWQYFLKQWYDWVSFDSSVYFEGDSYDTGPYSNGYDMYEADFSYCQKERWFNLPDFVEYTMSLQVHDHCLILRVYDYYEPVLLYYIQII